MKTKYLASLWASTDEIFKVVKGCKFMFFHLFSFL